MATKPRPSGRKKAPEAASDKAKEKSQRERFIEAAHEIGVDESGKEFERLFNAVIPPQQKPSTQKS